jgi:hypothetical protein
MRMTLRRALVFIDGGKSKRLRGRAILYIRWRRFAIKDVRAKEFLE